MTACGDPPIVPSTNGEALRTPAESGPTRYEISDGMRVLGVAELSEDGRPRFTVADDLPSPCLADTLATSWKGFEWPDTVWVDAGYYDPKEKMHVSAMAEFDRSSDDYPLAVLHELLWTPRPRFRSRSREGPLYGSVSPMFPVM